jgi:hypothetical protein
VQASLRPDRLEAAAASAATPTTLSPRDIQARIRTGESAEDVARVAGVPVDRVLRYAGPVLQERAMLAQHARRTKLRSSGGASGKGATLAEVVDARLSQHGVDTEKISWDAYRRDDGAWRVVATWPSGKATAQAQWELDKARQVVTPHDDMAQYLCAERPTQILGQDPPMERPMRGESSRGELGRGESSRGELSRGESSRGELGRGESSRGELGRGGHEPMRPASEPPRRETRPGRNVGPDPIRAGRDALLASLDRPLGNPRSGGSAGRASRETTLPPATAPTPPAASAGPVAPSRPARGAAALIGQSTGSPFDDDRDAKQDAPAVPSLAVLRPRRTAQGLPEESETPRKRLPSWDDVLFGNTPAARETS